jgi:hypothetical protein
MSYYADSELIRRNHLRHSANNTVRDTSQVNYVHNPAADVRMTDNYNNWGTIANSSNVDPSEVLRRKLQTSSSAPSLSARKRMTFSTQQS